MALAMTIVFMVIRAVVSGALQVVASPWIALAIGLAGAAVIASPSLIRGSITTFIERRSGEQVSGEVVDHDRP